MAFTAVGALLAGEFSATVVLGAMAEIGTAMSIVGAVTGNKTLMKVGAVVGIVGGVGGMINGAMSAGGAAAASGDAVVDSASLATGDLAGVSNAVTNGAEVVGGAASQTGGLTSAIEDAQSSLGANMNPTDMRLAAGTQGAPMSDTQALLRDTGAMPDTPINSDVMKTPAVSQAPAVQASAPAPSVDPNANPTDSRSADATQTTSMAPPVGAKDYFGRFMDWVKNNEKVANSVMTLGSGALKGMSERQMMNQKLAQQQGQFNTLYGHASEVATYNPASLLNVARGGN